MSNREKKQLCFSLEKLHIFELISVIQSSETEQKSLKQSQCHKVGKVVHLKL